MLESLTIEISRWLTVEISSLLTVEISSLLTIEISRRLTVEFSRWLTIEFSSRLTVEFSRIVLLVVEQGLVVVAPDNDLSLGPLQRRLPVAVSSRLLVRVAGSLALLLTVNSRATLKRLASANKGWGV